MAALLFTTLSILWMALPALAIRPSDYDPYAEGNMWQYRTTALTVFSIGEGETSKSGAVNSRGTVTTEIVSEQERRPNGDVVYQTRTTDRSKDDMPDAKEEVLVAESTDLVTKQGSYTLSTKAPEQHGGKLHKYEPPLFNYPADLKPGKTWVIGTIWEDELHYTDVARVEGTETVETPAGTFDDCIKIVITHNKMGGSMADDSGQSTEIKEGRGFMVLWLAKGVGLVKEEEIGQLMFDDSSHDNVPVTITSRSTKVLLPGYKVN